MSSLKPHEINLFESERGDVESRQGSLFGSLERRCSKEVLPYAYRLPPGLRKHSGQFAGVKAIQSKQFPTYRILLLTQGLHKSERGSTETDKTIVFDGV